MKRAVLVPPSGYFPGLPPFLMTSPHSTRLPFKYCDEYVCLFMRLFVRLSVHLHNSKTLRRNFKFCYACCLCRWLGPPLTALRYVMYFRFW